MTARKEFPAKRGRKPKAPEEKPRQFSIRVTHAHWQELQDLAYLLGGSVNEAVVYCVQHQLAHLTPSQKAALAAAQRVRNELRSAQ